MDFLEVWVVFGFFGLGFFAFFSSLGGFELEGFFAFEHEEPDAVVDGIDGVGGGEVGEGGLLESAGVLGDFDLFFEGFSGALAGDIGGGLGAGGFAVEEAEAVGDLEREFGVAGLEGRFEGVEGEVGHGEGASLGELAGLMFPGVEGGDEMDVSAEPAGEGFAVDLDLKSDVGGFHAGGEEVEGGLLAGGEGGEIGGLDLRLRISDCQLIGSDDGGFALGGRGIGDFELEILCW